MGYISYFTLNIFDVDGSILTEAQTRNIIKHLFEKTKEIDYMDEYVEEAICENGTTNNMAKWYGRVEDMTYFSTLYPDYYFTIYCEGENNELWQEFYHNGVMKDIEIYPAWRYGSEIIDLF